MTCFENINNDFDELIWHKTNTLTQITPRELAAIRIKKSTFSMVPFYYLRLLLEKNTKEIYDLGCGCNIFKKYIPNIIGVSPTHNIDHKADIHDFVDDDYVANHQNFFESVFSINALHFRPLNEFEQLVKEFVSMVKPGGRGFLACNFAKMFDITSNSVLIEHLGSPAKTGFESSAESSWNDWRSVNLSEDNYATCTQYIHDILSKISIKYLILDIDIQGLFDSGMDGNICIVFEK
jgi:hypothetical protein